RTARGRHPGRPRPRGGTHGGHDRAALCDRHRGAGGRRPRGARLGRRRRHPHQRAGRPPGHAGGGLPRHRRRRPEGGAEMIAYTPAEFRLCQQIFWRAAVMVAMGFGFPLLVGGLFPLIMPVGAWGGATLSAYLVTGVLVLALGMLAFMNLLEVLVQRRQQLILKRLRGTELPDLAIFAGEILCVIVVVIAQIALLIGLAWAVHGIALPANPALLLATVIAGTAVFA